MTDKPAPSPADEPVPEGVTVSKEALRKAREIRGEKRSKPAPADGANVGEVEKRGGP